MDSPGNIPQRAAAPAAVPAAATDDSSTNYDGDFSPTPTDPEQDTCLHSVWVNIRKAEAEEGDAGILKDLTVCPESCQNPATALGARQFHSREGAPRARDYGVEARHAMNLLKTAFENYVLCPHDC